MLQSWNCYEERLCWRDSCRRAERTEGMAAGLRNSSRIEKYGVSVRGRGRARGVRCCVHSRAAIGEALRLYQKRINQLHKGLFSFFSTANIALFDDENECR